MNLTHVQEGTEHIVKAIVTDDAAMDAFLFSLGCYAGEPITVVRRVKGGCVVSIKDGRDNTDNYRAAAFEVE